MAERKIDQYSNEEYISCNITSLQFRKDKYPQQCNACNKVYKTRKEYLKESFKLKKGSYSQAYPGYLLEYRNCECDSTMVCLAKCRRDDSIEGQADRVEFDKRLSEMVEKGFDKQDASIALRKEFRLRFIKRIESLQAKKVS